MRLPGQWIVHHAIIKMSQTTTILDNARTVTTHQAGFLLLLIMRDLAIVYLAIPRMLPKIIIAGNVHPVIQPSPGRVRSSLTMV
jgi:hypothetical protein